MTVTLSRQADGTDARTTRDASWLVCGGCRSIIYAKRFVRSLRVCPECGWHAPLTAVERLTTLLDPGSVALVDTVVADSDPLGFVDSRPYVDRLRDARAATGLAEAVVSARGRIDGNPVVVAAMDFRFMGGSLGAAVGEAVTQTAEIALRERTPLLLVTASGGARMQEGVLSLMQMAKTSQALGQLDEAGILTLALITDPTFGGVAASFATLPDIIIAEPGARLGFAGPRVIQQTIRQTLPPGFQTAEFLLRHGVVDMIRPRAELRATLARLLTVGSRRAARTAVPAPRSAPLRPPVSRSSASRSSASQPPVPQPFVSQLPAGGALVVDPERLPAREQWESVRLARRLGRPTTLDYIALMIEDWAELHGDRMAADCPAMVCGLGRLEGTPVVVIGTQKGRSAAELSARNYGMPSPAGYRKAARAMRLAAKLGLPVVTLIDTAGAFPGIDAEQNGQSVAIAENLRLMAGLPVPVVAVVTGEGGSGGALALAIADRVLMCANAVYSVISPEGCAAILWKDAAAGPKAAAALRVDARELLRGGIVDGVVPEPEAGADSDHLLAAHALRDALTSTLAQLLPRDQMTLVTGRRARFRRFGADTLTTLDDDRDIDHELDDDLDRDFGRAGVGGHGVDDDRDGRDQRDLDRDDLDEKESA
ncbi:MULTISPECIES: acetyl-CoA carboxylase, carboxyltransferase subunit beta [Protofrankia]|uniref:Multifunctional fusion protein n=1 Tax=Candidatus Protofrankia datiscae TaxID=2716812 RepID=F8B6L1_9ACTN|nr:MULTISPECIES: acetyl-CoA carboxylase, carboxyltransferase subunit beta [Protofrankia]AEH10220.1 Acetyl-coenzyme A carboxylase carboxyl transferase subunit beta [Candidatus Protofrankia datiscae]